MTTFIVTLLGKKGSFKALVLASSRIAAAYSALDLLEAEGVDIGQLNGGTITKQLEKQGKKT